MESRDRFRRHLASLGLEPGAVVVAVSGGPDSVALLDLIADVGPGLGLAPVVAHVDHGIAPESGEVARRVAALAARYGLPFRSTALGLGPGAGETAARARRYDWLERLRREVGASYVLTAHHADDQAETVLMRALEGSGPAGLAGMAARRGSLVRPLLPFRREELGRHLRARGLEAWQDPANADSRYLRSWLRAELLPSLRRRLPDVDARLLRLADEAAVERRGWDAALSALPGLELRAEAGGISVAAPALARYDSALAEAVVRAAARRVGCVVGARRAAKLAELARTGRSGASVPLGGSWIGEVAFGRLRIVRQRAAPAEAWTLEGPEGERPWGEWRVRWRREPAPALQLRDDATAWFAPAAFEVRAWHPGDRVRPLGGVGRRLVVRCLQDARVPRSRRAGWPVLAAARGVQAEGVLWVPGVCRSDHLLPPEGTEAVRVDVTDG
jgi:tRNA(Ile)-lysidine synthase